MRILYRTPSDNTFRELVVPNRLKVLQDLVGGPIESVTFAEDATILCNEEGRIMGQEFKGDEFCDCPMSVTMANGGVDG